MYLILYWNDLKDECVAITMTLNLWSWIGSIYNLSAPFINKSSLNAYNNSMPPMSKRARRWPCSTLDNQYLFMRKHPWIKVTYLDLNLIYLVRHQCIPNLTYHQIRSLHLLPAHFLNKFLFFLTKFFKRLILKK